ncbi:type II toxin-antitoxin system PemK/MazF family toxin [Treponema denticola]|uniref:type II toxin-antitoxin system PemK/MazF family toxin n=1 Tax=Treponema denticola TaxID=158 RepID=UPI002649844C|nr:type II toxin-antitoxin system PemK/MazF family toxin [Treponema denticola]
MDFGIPVRSLPAYRRPVIIMQNKSELNTVFVVPLTTNLIAADYSPNVTLTKAETNLPKDSIAIIHLMGPVNKYSFIEKISKIKEDSYKKIVNAINTFIS